MVAIHSTAGGRAVVGYTQYCRREGSGCYTQE